MIIPSGYAQLNFRMTGDNCPTGAEVVIGVDNTEEDQGAATLAAAGIAIWVEAMAPVLADSVTLSSVLAKKGPNSTGAFAEVASGITGSGSWGAIPPQSAVLINKVTALGGRKNRGRSFWPGANEANVGENGTLTGGELSDWQDAADLFASDLEDAHIPMVILHASAGTPTPVTSYQVSTLIGTQRDRIRR